ncbi:hypothetical protein I7I53_02584 [Histoplasma capsulatum var. duboisii H88]|uniref:Uncharacterized protein n=1 Tax=Ajellomyces capsulatus (strain H88) TaxID=544711 RepID=A0A8A1LR30_AJEC8|nr:hypothetical protein I7I53_02584 [Histoplasma capsulatum var. duboisii H88]
MPPDKPNNDRRHLQSNGMTYTKMILPEEGNGDLPDDVELYKQALLDFGGSIPDWAESPFKTTSKACLVRGCGEDIKSPQISAHDDSTQSPVLSADLWQQIEHCFSIAKKAQNLAKVHAPQHEWKHLLRGIFKRYKDISPAAENQQKLFEQFSLEENILWDDQKRSTEDYPKPDFTYGYTINNDIPVSLRSTEIVMNFSLEVLGDLRSAGLISSPISGLREWAKDKATSLSQDQLICFPFAMVELRPCGVSFLSENESCYSQAANGALAALRLNEKLCNWATASYDSVPPVVAFTCVGAEIRVWLAFSEVKDNIRLSRRMVCIWESSLFSGWAVVKTCAIVKNMLLWASRVWKPKISGHISRIQQNKISFPLDRLVTQASVDTRPFEFSAKSTKPTPPQPLAATKPLLFEFGSQRPSRIQGNNQGPRSDSSAFNFGAQPSIPKRNEQSYGFDNFPPWKLFANTAEKSINDKPQKDFRRVWHRNKLITVRLPPNVNHDRIVEPKQKQKDNEQQLSHSSPAAETRNTAEDQPTNKIFGNVHSLGHASMPESSAAVEKLSGQINLLGLNETVQTASGIQPTKPKKSPPATDVIPEALDRGSRGKYQGKLPVINLGQPRRKTSSVGTPNAEANSNRPRKQGDESTEGGSEPLGKAYERDHSPPLNTKAAVDGNSSSAGPSKLSAGEGQEACPEIIEDFRDSPDEPELMIGTCPHYGSMVAESLQLLRGNELLRLNVVSKITLELQGLELLDVTWSVLELWVAQHTNVPSSPCEALEKIIRELNGALELPGAIITAENMWASEPSTWENIDRALQSILQSDEAKLKNIMAWAIECMDLLEGLELCDILKFGELSCLELKRMDREIIDILRTAEADE